MHRLSVALGAIGTWLSLVLDVCFLVLPLARHSPLIELGLLTRAGGSERREGYWLVLPQSRAFLEFLEAGRKELVTLLKVRSRTYVVSRVRRGVLVLDSANLFRQHAGVDAVNFVRWLPRAEAEVS